jgi:hypothetical protein
MSALIYTLLAVWVISSLVAIAALSFASHQPEPEYAPAHAPEIDFQI